jgi:hypothetical protein
MADLTQPIDISSFNAVAKRYQKEIKPVHMLAAAAVLQYMTPKSGVRNSLVLTKMDKGSVSRKYDGTFKGDKTVGTPEQRTLNVYPVVAEISDEPEKYRRTFIDEIYTEGVAGGDATGHRFMQWLAKFIVQVASEELYYAVWQAKYDEEKSTLMDSFDGVEANIAKAISDGLVSVAKNNLYDAGGEFTTANIGDKLKEMWRSAHPTMRERGATMYLSQDMGDMYDDWYQTEHDKPPMVDTAGQTVLEGSNGKCKIVRLSCIDNQRVVITDKSNLKYGFDKTSDMKNVKAFNSGNPYTFDAYMKYVFGTQIESVNYRHFLTSKLYDASSGSA